MVAEREATREQRFIGTLIRRTARFTPFFVGANVALFGLMWLAGGMGLLDANQSVLIGFGAKVNELISQGQYWRLITSIFLHIGFLHLFFNNYALWIIGQEIERFYGSSRFVLIYLLTGIAGSTASYLYISDPKSVSAGASGAIFGLFGVMITFPFRYRKEIPDALRKGIIRSILPVIVINLVISFSVEMIDQAAHIGGFVTGIALALIIPYKRPGEKMTALAWRALCVVCLTLITLSFITAFSHYQMPELEIKNLTLNPGKGITDYWEGMRRNINVLAQSDESFTLILDRKDRDEAAVIRLKRSVETAITDLEIVSGIDEESNQYRNGLLDLLRTQRDLFDKYIQTKQPNTNSLMSEKNDFVDKAKRFLNDYNQWIVGFMEKHGYKLTTEKERQE